MNLKRLKYISVFCLIVFQLLALAMIPTNIREQQTQYHVFMFIIALVMGVCLFIMAVEIAEFFVKRKSKCQEDRELTTNVLSDTTMKSEVKRGILQTNPDQEAV